MEGYRKTYPAVPVADSDAVFRTVEVKALPAESVPVTTLGESVGTTSVVIVVGMGVMVVEISVVMVLPSELVVVTAMTVGTGVPAGAAVGRRLSMADSRAPYWLVYCVGMAAENQSGVLVALRTE